MATERPNKRLFDPNDFSAAATNDPLQSICPKLKCFALLFLVDVMDVNAKGHPCLGRGAMVGDVAENDRGNAKFGCRWQRDR